MAQPADLNSSPGTEVIPTSGLNITSYEDWEFAFREIIQRIASTRQEAAARLWSMLVVWKAGKEQFGDQAYSAIDHEEFQRLTGCLAKTLDNLLPELEHWTRRPDGVSPYQCAEARRIGGGDAASEAAQDAIRRMAAGESVASVRRALSPQGQPRARTYTADGLDVLESEEGRIATAIDSKWAKRIAAVLEAADRVGG